MRYPRFWNIHPFVSPYDNKIAIQQIEDGHKALLHREAYSLLGNDSVKLVK